MSNNTHHLFVGIVAAGIGSRMKKTLSTANQYFDKDVAQLISTTAKQYLPLNGKFVLNYSIDLFLSLIDTLPILKVSVALNPVDDTFVTLGYGEKVNPVIGGIERHNSVFNLVDYCFNIANQESLVSDNCWIMIHDAARPLISDIDVVKLWNQRGNQGAILASKASDTIKLEKSNGQIDKTLDRNLIWQAQTPQIFRLSTIHKLFDLYYKSNFPNITDEASLLEMYGYEVNLVESNSINFKITNAVDLLFAETLITNKQ